jgi:hypothetical protein
VLSNVRNPVFGPEKLVNFHVPDCIAGHSPRQYKRRRHVGGSCGSGVAATGSLSAWLSRMCSPRCPFHTYTASPRSLALQTATVMGPEVPVPLLQMLATRPVPRGDSPPGRG